MKRGTALQIVEKAQLFGGTLTGIVRVADLGGYPSTRASDSDESWLRDDQSVLIVALEHTITEPELDWWGARDGTEGNHHLRIICEKVIFFLAREFKIESQLLHNQPGNLGIYLKDAAALAGMGTIGANNLLITPQYGPRIRLRGVLLDADFPKTEAFPFSPCETCDRPLLASPSPGGLWFGVFQQGKV
jgi:epoxyqueuosine reductase